jgi:hypothetical protein
MRSLSPLPRILLLLASLVAVTALLAGCGGDDESRPSGGPRQLLEEAVAKPIESGQIDMRIGANVPGFPILGSRLSLTGQGPFASNGRDGSPTLDWKVKLRADAQVFPARLRAVDDRVFVEFMGLSYEADPELIGELDPDEDERSEGGGGISLEQLGVHAADWLSRLRMEDGEEIGGDSTRKITGTVNVSAVVDDAIEALESSGIRERLGESDEDAAKLTDLSDEDRERLEGAIRDVEVQVNIDDEGYARRAYAKLDFVMPKEVKGTAIKRGTITFDLVLEKVGDVDVQISPPASPRDLDSLFRLISLVFGIDELSDIWRKP